MVTIDGWTQITDWILLPTFALVFALIALIIILPALSFARRRRAFRLAEAYAAEGPEGWLKLEREFVCPRCVGKGDEACDYCGGAGGKEEYYGGTFAEYTPTYYEECSVCGGTGRRGQCSLCRGLKWYVPGGDRLVHSYLRTRGESDQPPSQLASSQHR